MSLAEAISALLANNPEVLDSRREWLASREKAAASLGAFEPSLAAGWKRGYTSYEDRFFPERTAERSLGVEGRLPSGTEYDLGYTLTDFRHPRNTLDRPKAFSGLSLTQPLLRGAWYGAPLAEARIAKEDREYAFNAYRAKLMDAIAEMERYYWNLRFAEEKTRFSAQSVEIARKLLDDSRVRVRTGKMSQADLLEAEAGLGARLAALADARQERLEAMNQLELMLLPADSADARWLRTTTPIDAPDSAAGPGSRGPRPDEALALHPEVRAKQAALERESIALRYRKDRRLPDLKFKGSYGYNGFGSTTEAALYRLSHEPRPAWSAEIQLGLPLWAGVEARKQYAAQSLKRRSAETDLRAARFGVAASRRLLSERLMAIGEGARSARTVADLRRTLLDIELRKLDAGMSTNRLAYEAEERWSQARLAWLESEVRQKIARTQLARSQGTLLRDRALEIIEGGKPILAGPLAGGD